MIVSSRINITRLLIIAFLFFLIPSDTFSLRGDERAGLKLIKAAEKLFKNYKYQDSINKFRDAEKYVKSEKNLSRLYLGISRSYYAMGLMSQVKEAINKLAMLSVKSSFKRSKYPRGYLKIYNDIQAEIERKKREEQIVKTEEESESLYQVEATGEETKEITKKSLAGVIEKQGKKKKKKKSLLLPLTLGVVALGVVAMLMGKKSGEESSSGQSLVHITSSPSGATVYVDGVSKGVITPGSIQVDPGNHNIRLVIDGWGETTSSKSFDHTIDYTLNAQLAPYKYESVLNYSLNSLVESADWDIDNEGNLYSVYYEGGSYKLIKYDSYGSEIFSRQLEETGQVNKYIQVLFNNWNNNLYIYKRNDNRAYWYDSDGEFVDTQKGPTAGIKRFDASNNGDIYYINENRDKVGFLNPSTFAFSNYIVNEAPGKFWGINCSNITEQFYVATNWDMNEVQIFDYSGHKVGQMRDVDETEFKVSGSNSSDGDDTGLEKLFVEFSVSNFTTSRIVVFSNNGEILTRTADFTKITKVEADDSWNFYLETEKNQISKFEPSGETEGEGIWEASSVASTSSRMRSHGTTGIDPFRSKRSGKPEIDKDREKRGKKDL